MGDEHGQCCTPDLGQVRCRTHPAEPTHPSNKPGKEALQSCCERDVAGHISQPERLKHIKRGVMLVLLFSSHHSEISKQAGSDLQTQQRKTLFPWASFPTSTGRVKLFLSTDCPPALRYCLKIIPQIKARAQPLQLELVLHEMPC